MRWIAVGLAVLLLASAVHAQPAPARIVPSCGTPPANYAASAMGYLTVDTNGNLCQSGSGSTGSAVTTSPAAATSTQTGFTITTGNAFQSIAASNASRKSCLIQNTSTHTMYVFFGATGSATTAGSFQVTANSFMSCANPAGTVLTDNIAVTTSTTSDTGVVNVN